MDVGAPKRFVENIKEAEERIGKTGKAERFLCNSSPGSKLPSISSQEMFKQRGPEG